MQRFPWPRKSGLFRHGAWGVGGDGKWDVVEGVGDEVGGIRRWEETRARKSGACDRFDCMRGSYGLANKLEGMPERNPRSIEWFTKSWGLTVLVLTLPLFLVFLGDPGRGLAASISAFSVIFIARYLWDLRSRVWFWITLVAVVLAHSCLVLSIPWPNLRGGLYGLAPVMFLQIFLIRAIFWLVERLVGFFAK